MNNSLIPYHDMHNRFGETLTWKPLSSSHKYYRFWEEYATDPKRTEHAYCGLLSDYVKLFQSVFLAWLDNAFELTSHRNYFLGVYPISFHGHSSDAVIPNTIGSLLRHLAYRACKATGIRDQSTIDIAIMETLHWSENHQLSPQIAVLRGSYGAGYGALVRYERYKEWIANMWHRPICHLFVKLVL